MPSPRSAANPAPRLSEPASISLDCSPVAVSGLVTGLSRTSCRDASGLAVLMSTGRRAGLPGLSCPAAPRSRWPGSCVSPARGGYRWRAGVPGWAGLCRTAGEAHLTVSGSAVTLAG
jgi:hypothetical protein